MIPRLDATGFLPLGRHQATWSEIEDRFCFSDHRRYLYDECRRLATVAQAVPPGLSAVWLGGSFVSAKPEPSDIDAVFVRNEELDAQLGEVDMKVVDAFADGVLSSVVDSVILGWRHRSDDCHGGPDYEARGFFDFRMSRVKGLPQPDLGCPRKGYLEVIIDGYQ